MLSDVYPEMDPVRPDWAVMRADLVVAGVMPSELEFITSTDLVAMAYGRRQQPTIPQPDNKTDNSKKSRKNPVPENPDVSKLAKYMKRQWKSRPNDSKKSLALEFTDGDDSKTNSLLRELRRFPHLLD
jgi:hypothetical protein